MPTPPPRQPPRRNGALALGLAALIATALAPWLLHVGVVPRPSPLTRNLPNEFQAASRVFDARIQTRFPPGVPETRLLAELSRQGFREGPGLGAEQERVRREGSLVCKIAARVYWRVDEASRIQRVRGVYREEGCL